MTFALLLPSWFQKINTSSNPHTVNNSALALAINFGKLCCLRPNENEQSAFSLILPFCGASVFGLLHFWDGLAWARGLTIKINLSEIVFTGIRFLLTTNDIYRHMASSASGQDERNRQLCRGYPSGQDGAILPAGDYPLYPASKIPQKPYNIFFIDQVCSVKMAGYWPRSFFASLWTSTL